MTVAFCGALGWGLSATAGLGPDFGEPTVQSVPAGETVPATTLTFGDRPGFYKTGAGTLAVDAGRIARTTDGRLTVLEGAVAVTAGAAADLTTPPAVCDKAAFWVNETSVVVTGSVASAEGGGGYASRWCDVREPNTAAPTRLYAEPKWCSSADYPASLNGIDPVTGTFDDRAGVYFGGATSGQYMGWKKAGAAANLTGIQHLFIVHAVTNCVGHPVGYENGGRKGPFLNALGKKTRSFNPNEGASMLYNRGDVCGPQMSARFFLDGEQVDPRVTKQKAGWQLFSCDYKDILPGANNFYRCGFSEGFYPGCQGGDWLGEVLVFTNVLQEAERVAVERYLLAKWNLPQMKGPVPRVKGTELALAEGTSATVAGEADTVTPPLSFAGAGNVTKTGAGVLALGPTDGLAFAGDFDWQAGALRLQGGRIPALAVGSGETYAFTGYVGTSTPTPAGDAASGLTCTKTTDGKAGVVETTGNGWLRVHTVKPGVKRLKVGIAKAALGSVLQLEGRVLTAATPTGGDVEAVFPNPDMELPFEIQDLDYDLTRFNQGTSLNGWTARVGQPRFICTQREQTTKQTWLKWLMDNSGDPSLRGGTNLLQLVQRDAASTTVTVPMAGIYELAFDAKSRYGYVQTYKEADGYAQANKQPQVEICLGRTWSEAKVVGTLAIGTQRFFRFRYRLSVPEAGNWELGFRPVDTGRDACLFLDNFRLVRVAEPSAEEMVDIPNGSFDQLVRPATAEVTAENPFIRARYCTLNVPASWTVSVDAGTTYASVITNGVIGSITTGTIVEKGGQMQFFPLAAATRGAAALGFASTGGRATSASFAVPAGTWHLRGLVQRLASFVNMNPVRGDVSLMGTPAFCATLTRADGGTLDLGAVTAATQRLAPAIWPTAFTVTEGESVTLTLTQTVADAMGLVDELSLVRAETADFGNLIAESGFEKKNSAWKAYVVPDAPTTKYMYSIAEPIDYRDRPEHWGYCAWEGERRLRLQNGKGVYQDLAIPQAGLHRFTMHVRARADLANYANNIVRVWLAQESVTNVLATTPTLYTRHWVEVSYLVDVPAAGTYRLGIEGRCRGADTPSNADLDAHIDGVSLVRCRDEQDEAPSLPEGLRIDVAKGAQLFLDYTGTAVCGPVFYNGELYSGTLNAATHPEFITGSGTLEAIPFGLLFIVR